MSKPIRVEIDQAKFWSLASGHPVYMNVSVFKALRDAGIPVDGGIDMRGVLTGRLVMWNEIIRDKRYSMYEWTPGPDTITAASKAIAQSAKAPAPAVESYEEI